MSRSLKITSVNRVDGDQKVVARSLVDRGATIFVCTLLKLDNVSLVNLREFSEAEIAVWEAASGLPLGPNTFHAFLKAQFGA
ncbi:MAG TPA: hypothetical protein VGM98_12235 [Schlesneria sp.]|jgi:hypothetical protein